MLCGLRPLSDHLHERHPGLQERAAGIHHLPDGCGANATALSPAASAWQGADAAAVAAAAPTRQGADAAAVAAAVSAWKGTALADAASAAPIRPSATARAITIDPEAVVRLCSPDSAYSSSTAISFRIAASATSS